MANYQSRGEEGLQFLSNAPFSAGVLAFSMAEYCLAVDSGRSDLAQWTRDEEKIVIVIQCLVFCLQNNDTAAWAVVMTVSPSGSNPSLR